MTNSQPADALNFWFSDDVASRHFDKDPDFDQQIRDRFLDSYEQARKGQLDAFRETPKGALALVIILDAAEAVGVASVSVATTTR